MTGRSQQACTSNTFPPQEQFLPNENVTYLTPDTTQSVGYLVIVPQMRFDCHGYVTGWSALTRLCSSDPAIDYLKHGITFQLWRPSTRDSGSYTFVGSNSLGFIGRGLRAGLTVVNGTQFFKFTSAQPSGNQGGMRLAFQPGDVIGWYIHTLVQSVDIPLTVVYRYPRPPRSGGHANPSLRPVSYTHLTLPTIYSV